MMGRIDIASIKYLDWGRVWGIDEEETSWRTGTLRGVCSDHSSFCGRGGFSGGNGAFSESILESAGNILEMPHSAGTGGVPTLSLGSPFVRTCLGGWVTTGGTSLVLFVERSPTTSTALRVGLAVALTKGGCTFRHLEVGSSCSAAGVPIEC